MTRLWFAEVEAAVLLGRVPQLLDNVQLCSLLVDAAGVVLHPEDFTQAAALPAPNQIAAR